MKKISFLSFLEIALGTAAAIMFIIFFALTASDAAKRSAAEGELRTSIDEAVGLCDSFDQRINIEEDLRPYVDIYKNNIQNSDSLERKAYYTNILLTYVQNRVNMNNPKTLLELSKELGTHYETDSKEIAAYSSYINDIAAAFERFKTADESYSGKRESDNVTVITENQ